MILATALAQLVVVFVLDDVGARDIDYLPTPNIDALSASGVTFTRGYAQPWCAPTRDSLYRSRWAATGHGDICTVQANTADYGVPTFPKLLDAHGYSTVLIGKPHLGAADLPGAPWTVVPHLFGFNHWRAGQPVTLGAPCSPQWRSGDRIDDGVISRMIVHHTEAQRDETVSWLLSETEPAVSFVCFRDAHSPWDIPPASLMPQGYVAPAFPTDRDRYEAEILALDQAVGYIVSALPSSTWYILIGDNGTPALVDVDDLRGSKLEVYEGGIRVPFIFSGPGLTPGMVVDAPVSVTDLAPTIAAALDIQAPAHYEGQSLVPALCGMPLGRPWIAAQNAAAGTQAVVEQRYKLVRTPTGDEFYDLELDPGETLPLPNLGPDYDRLAATMSAAFQ